ncbi:MAG: assimilatory sulfite reductase (NADPH) flavoprotein subunit [Prolixibacteraceae bacterium]|nr:assimilatory sulfite reductase (NADPH) flavoprotein subunit [Prolixibacteraceae bacterium]
MNTTLNPFSPDQQQVLSQLLKGASPDQLYWLSGFISGISEQQRVTNTQQIVAASLSSSSETKLTILYGTHTGHSEAIARELAVMAERKGILVKLSSLDEYKIRDLVKERHLALVVSTHGEGEPPLMAEALHEYLKTGKVKLPHLHYAVLALGDRSYKHFCQTGIDFDEAFKAAGGKELLPIVTCDVAYESEAGQWVTRLIGSFDKVETVQPQIDEAVPITPTKSVYSRQNPFLAPVIEQRKITGRHSDKEVWHVALSLEDSGLRYEPGDAVGIFSNNSPELVQQLIDFTGFAPNTTITTKYDDVTLYEALFHYFEITVLTRKVLMDYANIVQQPSLQSLIENDAALDEYVAQHDLLDLLQDFPGKITAHQLINTLRYLPPRLYSISSGAAANPEEVHLTIAKVKYEHRDRLRKGACSSFISDRLPANEKIPLFIEKNVNFRLPASDKAPLIMIGAGTGVAPYRSFLQDIEELGRNNKTWLIFGERTFTNDFLYQVEWQRFLQKGVLSKIDLAFSRDQEQKVYVQHKLQENAAALYDWLEQGASLYVCGDRKKMFNDVQQTLLEIIQTQGGVSEDKAREYLKKLKREKRMQTDVY